MVGARGVATTVMSGALETVMGQVALRSDATLKSRSRQRNVGLGDVLRLQARLGGEHHQQRFVLHHVVEHAGQDMWFTGAGAQCVQPHSRQCEKPSEALAVRRKKRQRLQRDRLGGVFFGFKLLFQL